MDLNNNLFRVPDLIMKKRNGCTLTENEINFFISALVNKNQMDPTQIGAMLMAIYFSGMDFNESYFLTKSMMDSGDKLDLNGIDGVVDKHSTGGVGDKISLPLVPALIACGLKVPMVSGRGLGWTGGTLDKLESIVGCSTRLPKEKIKEMINGIGGCICGQTNELNPADRILYSTRDITSTVDCIPLIASSIISKKAIECLNALVLDVKFGKAAFLKEYEKAEQLANYMTQISKMLDIKACAFITIHDNPIGRTIGNQIEIEETIECLHGNIPDDIAELVSNFGGCLLKQVERCKTLDEGRQMIMETLKNGTALEIFKQMIIEQGVDEQLAIDLCDNRNYSKVFKKSKYTTPICSNVTGFIRSIDALELGVLVAKLGAGRQRPTDTITYEIGMRLLKVVGDEIRVGDTWLEIYHNTENFDDLYGSYLNGVMDISDIPIANESLIYKIVEA